MPDQLPLFDLPPVEPGTWNAEPELPASLRRLLEAGYPGDALEPLMERFGGRQLRIPKRVGADHELAQVLGLHAAGVLVAELGGVNNWDVPRGHSVRIAARHAAIRRDYDRLCAEGCRNRMVVLVERYRPITTRQIRNILGKAE